MKIPNFLGIQNTYSMQELLDIIKSQNEIISNLKESFHEAKKEIVDLKDEILKLKKETTKPKIKPSKLNSEQNSTDDKTDKKKNKRKSQKGIPKKKKNIEVQEEKEIQLEEIPEDAKFIGYREVIVQDIKTELKNIRYKLAKYETSDGKIITAKLPTNLKNSTFGPELRVFILQEYHIKHVTQPLLLEQLQNMGIEISSGQLSNIITEKLDNFHEEKDTILKVALPNSDYIQTDDTGARHDGVNGYCTQIGNEFFTWFSSTQSKSRVNFLELLSHGVEETLYTFNEISYEYMTKQKLPKKFFDKLKKIKINITDKKKFQDWLTENEIVTKTNIRTVTEAALIGGLTTQGIPVELGILSDGARQFNIFNHALCWIHAERPINRLIPLAEKNKKFVEVARKDIWKLYQKLKNYKTTPNENLKQKINDDFDKFSIKITGYESLDKAIKNFKDNKSDLLKVLENPNIPLHNNLSENDIRDYVKKRKISGGTRSEVGRKVRDTFASLKKTCKKLSISSYDYIQDRVFENKEITPLADLVLAKIRSG
jgi:hypothetical protein